MKTYKNLYRKLCSEENIFRAYKKARKGKTKKRSVREFEKNLDENLKELGEFLREKSYSPSPLKRFVVRDLKSRVIHASSFQDRIVHHALINIIGPIFEKRFIYDSYASRIGKGTHNAVARFNFFKRKVSKNGQEIKGGRYNRNNVVGYVLKADIKKYFENVDHLVLLEIIKNKIKDEDILWLIKTILSSFNTSAKGKGMPLGNYTSQFFANVYLNKLDYFVKHRLKAKYYIRYVDDFIIFHRDKSVLEEYKDKIEKYLLYLKIELHPEKSQIIPLKNGVSFLGYNIFYHHILLKKRNRKYFFKKLQRNLYLCEKGEILKDKILDGIIGWLGYARGANTHNLLRKMFSELDFELNH